MSSSKNREEYLKQLKLRILFYEDGLSQYSFALSASAQYIVGETIKDLKELKRLKETLP